MRNSSKVKSIAMPLAFLAMLAIAQGSVDGPVPSVASDDSQGDITPTYYIVGGATHEWIAFQGFVKLPPGGLRTEMANYLPTNADAQVYGNFLNGQAVDPHWLDLIPPYVDNNHMIVPANAMIQGTYEEDAEGAQDGTIDGVHFWNPNGGAGAGLFLDGKQYPSALQEAQMQTFSNAVAAYVTDKAAAYYWLGRTAHLLADMSVPAHANLDGHGAVSTDDDQYEKIVAASYKLITAASTNTDIPTDFAWSIPPGFPAGYDPDLSALFYNMAKTARQFDSDNVNGDSDAFGRGQFRYARNTLTSGKAVLRVEYWNTIGGFKSSKIRDLVPGTDYAIQPIGEYRIYYYPAFYFDINNTSRAVNVIYEDASSESYLNLEEAPIGDIFTEPLQSVYQPRLQAQVIGYTAGLYQLFWKRTHPNGFRITAMFNAGTNGETMELKFLSESGAVYRVQSAPRLTPPAWTDAGVTETGNGAEQVITVPTAGLETRRYFRVHQM